MKNPAVKTDFAARLNHLLDEAGIPEKFDGRQVALAKIVGLTQKGVRKWLEGEGMPTLERCIQLANHFGVHTEWLVSGRGEKYVNGTGLALSELPDDVRQETIDFLTFKLQRQFTGDQLARYLRWLDHIRNNRPGRQEPK